MYAHTDGAFSKRTQVAFISCMFEHLFLTKLSQMILPLLPSYKWISACQLFTLTNRTFLSTLLRGVESGVVRSAIHCSVLIRLTIRGLILSTSVHTNTRFAW